MSGDAAAPAPDEAEEAARAGLYALIGRLFFGAPDADLLSHMTANVAVDDHGHRPEDTALGRAWQQLAASSASAEIAALQHEHAMLFVGVGKAPVTPYTSAYVPGVSPERHLLQLKQQLDQWGLAVDVATATPEDHLSALCDTMRHLILRGEPIAVQKAFFERFIHRQCTTLCRKLADAEPSAFYRALAHFTNVFLTVEHEGFDMIVAAS